MGFLNNLFSKKEGNLSKTCSKCRKPLERAEDMFSPNAVVIGSLPVLYKGVVCTNCGKIECTKCKGQRLQAPCSWCGGKVSPATENLLK